MQVGQVTLPRSAFLRSVGNECGRALTDAGPALTDPFTLISVSLLDPAELAACESEDDLLE